MPKLIYIAHDGTEHTVEAAAGGSVMQAAVDNGVPGIDADCGGACACATCHVMVADEWWDKTGGPEAAEDGMLDMTIERVATSRLSCQIDITDELDGLVVRMPESQF